MKEDISVMKAYIAQSWVGLFRVLDAERNLNESARETLERIVKERDKLQERNEHLRMLLKEQQVEPILWIPVDQYSGEFENGASCLLGLFGEGYDHIEDGCWMDGKFRLQSGTDEDGRITHYAPVRPKTPKKGF